MSDARCLVNARYVSSRTCGESSGGTTEAVHILGNKKPKARVINDDFHDPQNEETRGINARIPLGFSEHTCSSHHTLVPFSSFVFLDLACHVVNSRTSLHDFSFSHILPVLGLAPVSRQVSSHLPPSSSAEMPQRLGARVRDQILTNLHPAVGFVWSLPRRMISPSQRLEVAAS